MIFYNSTHSRSHVAFEPENESDHVDRTIYFSNRRRLAKNPGEFEILWCKTPLLPRETGFIRSFPPKFVEASFVIKVAAITGSGIESTSVICTEREREPGINETHLLVDLAVVKRTLGAHQVQGYELQTTIFWISVLLCPKSLVSE